jgi:signal transduction histidine kinase
MIRLAPRLLGPTAAERLAALQRRTEQLAERNRLARELHDSVGHALTATTLQAGAARAVFDRDPEFVRRALAAIEEVGRTAVDDLDRVLGVLRSGADHPIDGRTLEHLDRLIEDVRRGGVDLDARVRVSPIPDAVSREAFRIVQESLTNAAKHGAGAAELRVSTGPEEIVIEVVNPVAEAPARTGGGRGLAGIAERVRLLGGSVDAGPAGGRWRLVARIPVGRS